MKNSAFFNDDGFSNDFSSFMFKSTHQNWQCHDTLLMQEQAGVEETIHSL